MDDNKSTEPWYVMCHLNPRQIEVLLRKECEGRFAGPGERPSPFRFYIPYLYMPAPDTPDPSGYTDGLRSDFHNFVFVQAPAARVGELVSADWNTKARLRLYHYRDHEGRSVVVPDDEVRRLMSTFRDRTVGFFIGQPIEGFEAGDRVVLNVASWAGQEGVVREVRLRKGRLTMTISLNIFNRTKSINFTDLRTGDVTFVDAAKGSLFTGNPVDRFEEEVIDLLSRRLGSAVSREAAQADAERLKRLSAFDRMYMEPDDADRARLLSLRLICAVLRQNRRQREVLLSEAVGLLTDGERPGTADEAYVMTALFVATRQARYRDAAKAYRSVHPDAPDILRRFHSIVKKMKAKKPQSLKNSYKTASL